MYSPRVESHLTLSAVALASLAATSTAFMCAKRVSSSSAATRACSSVAFARAKHGSRLYPSPLPPPPHPSL
ncbi:hypothetical protein QYE76_039452 [Lolium multiflorum]|uniref:Uncharacterized protein n=1 Tax=Lolium multiflorum TaxID=4521 RepID=A0AAD8WS66_LOLMU|nr:hypothetical protein QYE76_039452 [Lolium multiflorum]